jgi:hypothetical protein
MITHVVTSQILSNVGQTCGKGNELAEAYMEKFAKSCRRFSIFVSFINQVVN